MTDAAGSVAIACSCGSLNRFETAGGYAIVAVDVIRTMTTAVTAAALGRRVFPAPTVAAALEQGACLERPLLVGEVDGRMPGGFDLTNSPAALAQRHDIERPMVLVTSSGTPLLHHARLAGGPVYLACLRNARHLGRWLARRHARVALVAAASRGEFREEDQFCCARIAGELCHAGYRPADAETEAVIRHWCAAPSDAWLGSNSVAYLRRTGQREDLEFVLQHVDDLPAVFALQQDEIVALTSAAEALA